jgi:predicted lipoprotein with Yx(FWY)xxD motif
MTRGREADSFRRSRWWAGVGAAALTATALLATACSTEDATSPAALAQAPPRVKAMPLPAADGALVGPQPTNLGTVLVDGEGRTLYEFAGDTDKKSACTGACAQSWPFVPAPSPLPAVVPGVMGALGSAARPEGGQQLTIAGHPVYTFAGDVAPGQTNGQGKVVDGSVWSAVSATGTPVQSSPAAAGPVSTSLVGIPY